MVRKIKNNDSTIGTSKAPKFQFDEYRNMSTFRKIPVNNVHLDELAQELCQWVVANKDAITMEDFFEYKFMNKDAFKRLKEKNANLQEAYTFALMILGNRRQRGGLKKELDSGMVSYTMPHYDDEWKKLAEWRAALKHKEEEKNQAPTVYVIERFPETDEVPRREIDNEG
jgi:hypothetical protein